jgi:hypothetical protein
MAEALDKQLPDLAEDAFTRCLGVLGWLDCKGLGCWGFGSLAIGGLLVGPLPACWVSASSHVVT